MNNKFDKYVGQTFETNRCGVCEIVSMRSHTDVTVMFSDGNTTNVRMCNLRKGTVKNIYDKRLWLYGVGFNDLLGNTGSKSEKEYKLWSSILDRVYGKVSADCYKDVEVSKNWLRYSSFKESVKSLPNYEEFISDKWVIDKDLLSDIDNKVYSEHTCCFLPKELNLVLVGLGKKGYHFCKREKRFVAQIQQGGGKVKHLGYFDDETSARAAYISAKKERLSNLIFKWKGVLDQRVYDKVLSLYK